MILNVTLNRLFDKGVVSSDVVGNNVVGNDVLGNDAVGNDVVGNDVVSNDVVGNDVVALVEFCPLNEQPPLGYYCFVQEYFLKYSSIRKCLLYDMEYIITNSNIFEWPKIKWTGMLYINYKETKNLP